MRFVLGLTVTGSSAAWALVDTRDGSILAEELVALDSAHEIARAAALSVQAFDAQTEHDIEGIRLTWTDDAHQHGTRLRTKLRLFGFETVETVSEDAALAGRNKTARHLAPHLTLAYGAARADLNTNESGSVIQRLAARVPIQAAAWAAAAAAFVGAGVGVGLYGFGSHPTSEDPYTAAAEPNPQAGPQRGSVPAVVPSTPTEAPPTPAAVPPVLAKPPAVPAPSPEPVAAPPPATAVAQPETFAAPEFTTEVELDSTAPESLPTSTVVPHLTAAQHLSRPGRVTAIPPAGVPAAGPAQEPGTVAPPVVPPAPLLPAPLPPVPLPPALSSLFGALP